MEHKSRSIKLTVELRDGADVAPLSIAFRVEMTDDAFVESLDLLKAGHAAHPGC